MTATAEDLQSRLSNLEKQITARSREFAEDGEFNSVHEAYLERFQERRRALARKVDAAIASGDRWRMIAAEFERDIEGMRVEFVRWMEGLDARSLKRKN